MKFFQLLAGMALACSILPVSARADLIITGGTALGLAPGDSATVDFTISGAPLSSNVIAGFDLEFRITSTPLTTSVLQFTMSQPGPDFTNSSYIFHNISNDYINGSPFFPNPPINGFGNPNDTLVDGDLAADPAGRTVTSSDNLLLSTVQFQVDPGAQSGDSYQISLVLAGTHVFDDTGTDLTIDSASPALVTVTVLNLQIPPTVPLPSSLMLSSIGSLTGLLYYRRHRRRLAGC